MGVIWIIWMIQLHSDTLFFIGNFTILTEIETQSYVAPLVTRKSNKPINTIHKLAESLMHFASFSHCCGFVFTENPGTTGGPPLVRVLLPFIYIRMNPAPLNLFHLIVFSQHNGRTSSSGNSRGGVMIRKRRPNWIDAPDDSFFLVTRETR